MMKYLEVGKIVTTHGIRGEVKIQVITDNLSRFEKGSILYIGEEKEQIIVDNYRVQKNMVLLSFNGITNINDVLKYVNQMLYVDIDEVRDEDEIYYDDLIDCIVLVDEQVIGVVTDVIEVPQGEILQIKKQNGKNVLVPFVDEFIVEVDIKNKKIIIDPIEGLIWE